MDVAIITGGTGAIGKAIASDLSNKGIKCVIVDQSEPVEELDKNSSYYKMDISNDNDIDSFSEYLVEMDFKVKYFIHCAGVLINNKFENMARNHWRKVLQINLESSMSILQAVIPHLSENGSIVLFSSATIFKGPENYAAYVASKGGLTSFAKSLAAELGGRYITVNVIAPGLILTPMTEGVANLEAEAISNRVIKRKMVPGDLVGVVRFLISEDARFITGQTIVVDGGAVKH